MNVKMYGMALCLVLLTWNVVGAETLQLVTEDYPPFNLRVSGEPEGHPDDPVTGISVEIVKELFTRAGIDYTIRIYPWKRAYEMALNRSGYGVFSTFRTSEREPLFQWVGPLVPNNWVLMAKKSRNISINAVEDACHYTIGGYRGDAIAAFLEEQGCQIEYTHLDHLNAKKLEAERIDLWATGNLLGPYVAKRDGIAGLEPVFVIKETSMSLALNTSVSADTVANLNTILQEMKDDGTVDEIFTRYR